MKWSKSLAILLSLILTITAGVPMLGSRTASAAGTSTSYTSIGVPNGSFESDSVDYVNWTTTPEMPHAGLQVNVTQDRASSGSNSLYMADDTSTSPLEVKSALIPIEGGQTYRASSDIYVAGKSVRMYLRFLKSGSGTDLSGGTVNILANTVGEWKETTLETVAPTEAEFAQITFYYGTSGVGTYAFIDNVRLDQAVPLELEGLEVPNGSFEGSSSDYAPWTTVPGLPHLGLQVNVSQEQASEGNNSLYMADDTNSSSLEVKSALIPIQGGETYRAASDILVTGKSVRMYMRFLKSGSGTDLTGGAVNILANTVGEWKEVVLEAVAPSDAEFVQITYYYGSSGVGTYAYIDNVRLEHRVVQDPLEVPYGSPVNLGAVVTYALSQSASYGIGPDGTWEQYVTTTGSPVSFHVVDAQTGELKFTQPIAGSSDVIWGTVIASDGNVYFSTNGKLYRYLVIEQSIELLGDTPVNKTVFDLKASNDGKIYGSTYSNVNMGRVFEYDIETGSFRDLGVMKEGQQYSRGMGVTDEYVYVGIGTTAHLMRYDRATEEITEIEIPGVTGTSKTIAQVEIYGGKLFAHSGADLYVIDEETHELLNTLDFQSKIASPSPYNPDLIYYKLGGELYVYDMGANTASLVAGGPALPPDTAIKAHEWITPQSGPFAGRQVLAGMAAFGESFLYDPITGAYEEHVAALPASPTSVNSLEADESYLYIGGYQRGMSVYDIAQEEVVYENTVFHQPEGIGFMNGAAYIGTYSGAVLYKLDMDQPIEYSERGEGNPGMVLDIGLNQDRPFTMTSGDGKLFIGTFPVYGHQGGAVTVLEETETGITYETYRNLVPDQSIFGLAYANGKVYGSTSLWGGLGSPIAEGEAKLFVFDPASGDVERSFTPDIPDVRGDIKLIGELSIGPDGLLWGIADGYVDETTGYDAALFAMNPDTLEIVKSKVITTSPYNTSKYRPYFIRWGKDGLMYTTIGRKLFAVDPEDLNARQLIPNTVNLMTLGPDGTIYYTQSSNLYKLPVELASATLTFDAISLQVGDTVVGEIEVTQQNGLKPAIDWAAVEYQSSDAAVVGVNSGQLVSVGPGTAAVTATVTYADGRTIRSDAVNVTVAKSKPTVTLVGPAEPTDLAQGTDLLVKVQATAGSTVQIMEGENVVATGLGAGETPLELTVASPAVGLHHYTVTAVDADTGTSEPVTLPDVTVHELSAISIADEKVELVLGESYTVVTQAVYGPVTLNVTEGAELEVSRDKTIEIEGPVITAAHPGQAVVTVNYGGRQAEFIVMVMPIEPPGLR